MAEEIVQYDATGIASVGDLKQVLASNYMKQINNFFNDEKKALRFLSSVVADVQRNPKLLECDPSTLINSYIMMAELQLMPSGVSGEAYVLPYKNKGKMIAQFQLGYQGLVTLFYRAGVKQIDAEIVYEKDDFTYKNGQVEHTVDPWSEERGKPMGAYCIVHLQSGGKITKVLSEKEILEIAKKFSKSFNSDFSPWKGNDPQRWMWRKTVMKQAAKLVPKNETIFRAIAEDDKDSIISDRLEAAKEDSKSLQMGNLAKLPNADSNEKAEAPQSEGEATEGHEAEEDTEEPPN